MQGSHVTKNQRVSQCGRTRKKEKNYGERIIIRTVDNDCHCINYKKDLIVEVHKTYVKTLIRKSPDHKFSPQHCLLPTQSWYNNHSKITPVPL